MKIFMRPIFPTIGNVDGYTTTEEETTYSTDGLTKTVTVIETTQKTEKNDLNLKRIMTYINNYK